MPQCGCDTPSGGPDPCHRAELTEEQLQYSGGKHDVNLPVSDATCCRLDGTCEALVSITACEKLDQGGAVALGGDGASCTPSGACCLPDGTCEPESNKCCCELRGGQYMGDGSTECPVPPCQECGNDIREGTEQCDGTDDAVCPGACNPDCTCTKKISTVSEWALIVMVLLAFTLGTVLYGRRRVGKG